MGIFYILLNPILSPLLALGPPLVVFVVAAALFFIRIVMAKTMWDIDRIKRTQLEMIYNLRFLDQEHKLRAAELDLDLKRLQRPNFLTFVPLSMAFSWARSVFGSQIVIHLPYTFPFFGNDLGWVGWFILCSAVVSTLLSKVVRL